MSMAGLYLNRIKYFSNIQKYLHFIENLLLKKLFVIFR